MAYKDEHEFIVTAVEVAEDNRPGSVAIKLTDARGGRVRLHLSFDMAERLRERVASAIDRTEGP